MRIRGIFVAGAFLALTGGMPAAFADTTNYFGLSNPQPDLPDPPKQPLIQFAPSRATAGQAVPPPALTRAPEIDARACIEGQTRCAVPPPALERVNVTPVQIQMSRVPTRRHRG